MPNVRPFLAAAVLLLSSASAVFCQSISAALSGAVKDPAGAAVPGAKVAITRQDTRSSQTLDTNEAGLFVFPTLLPGVYDLEVSSAGFRSYQVRAIALTMNERRSLGDLVLQVGQLQERVEVTAEVTPVQTSSSERSGLISGEQLMNTAIKGRDFVALLPTLPGIVDMRSAAREVTRGPGTGGLHINGGRENSINMSLDGVQNLDTGSNNGMQTQPNMDAIAEVKVLASNYQAEYGRNSSGTVNVILKSGTQEFHGSGFWFYRHESLYANNFFSNRSGTPRPVNRINNFGYTIGGPVYVPNKFNRNKDKLFFFFSQEYVRRQMYPGIAWANAPTAMQREGDFSQTRDLNGALITVKDPATGQAFPGNLIPKSRINRLGQSILNFFPLPNYTEADPALRYARNHRDSLSGAFPRREDLFRIDYNFSPTLTAYFRAVEDNDDENWPYGGGDPNGNWIAGSHNFDLGNTFRARRGRGAVLHVTKTVNSRVVNEFTMGATTFGMAFGPTDPARVARSRMGDIGQWYPASNESGAIPNVNFSGIPNAITSGLGPIPYHNENPLFTFIDNVSVLRGTHALKFGIYIERQRKDSTSEKTARGAFDFGINANNPYDANYGFANALLGNFNTYSESTSQPYALYRYTQVEWYAQDSWKVSKRLHLELGVRFYTAPSAYDIRQNIVNFDPSRYDAKSVGVLLRPGLDANGKRAAVDPRNGKIYPLTYIGLFAPGSGDTAPGMMVGGKGGYPATLFATPKVSVGPRVGFSYDPFGNGKTSVRGGFGMFYDRPAGNVYVATVAQPPVAYTPTLSFGNVDTFLQTQGAVGPTNVSSIQSGTQSLPTVMNFSLGVQREVGFHTVVDAAYVGSVGRHLLYVRDINPIPMYARFDPANIDPTTPSRSPLQDNFLRPYRGLGSINLRGFGATSNYHSLQVAVNRRMARGLQYGVSYTFSKALGVGSTDTEAASPYFSPRARNYGPLSYDLNNVLVLSYIWDVPNLLKNVHAKALNLVFANWQISGINAFQSGPPITPGFTTTDGADLTGSGEGARIMVLGDPRLASSERTFSRNFKTEMFARPAVRSFGNAGMGILRGPGVNNWDISVSKRIPFGKSEVRYFHFRGEFYNAWNHTQFSTIDTTARFNPAGVQSNPNFGSFTAARDPRKVQLSLRLMF